MTGKHLQMVEELNFLLLEGIEVATKEGSTRIYFTLGLLLGDNEALNNASGFMEDPNATIYCRLCKMRKQENQKNCPLRDEFMRTPQQYVTDGFQNQKQTGVKENSIWNLVLVFHVVKNFCQDIAHDLLEGVCKYGMQHILYYLICSSNKILSLDELNAKLKSFNYEKNGFSNRPPLLRYDEINKKKKLHMSESEMHTFILIFPMLVEDIVEGGINIENEIWQYFSVLRQIMDICFAKSLRTELIDILDSLVNQHHNLYLKLFNDPLKLKFHNMKHYSLVIKMSGPLSHLNLLRFESKHRELKAIAISTTSRINPCHTIAVKEQLRLCHCLLGKHGLPPKFELGHGYNLECASLSTHFNITQDALSIDKFSGPWLDVKWVDINGIDYNIGSVVVLDVNPDGFLEFGKILNILANEDQHVLFIYEKLVAQSFNEEIHAYEIVNSNQITFSLAENLLSPFLAIHHYLSDGRDIVSLRHAV
ncbi:uncharacterized protein LOC117181282 [Belonocnema kinseyi]|uniref:uncharacterized protein LOC117181282 n=1 Tax=Belonocnema kinseyi TaxID=2817044 RepID=UPI00143DA91D|nr:uncharacterized protein LOC117181282 [Belonocnema kinseyi]